MSTLPAVLNNKLWIEHHPKLEARAHKVFSIKMYEEKICDKCEYRPERHCSICDECPAEAYLGVYKLWKKVERGDKLFIGLPIGRPDLIKKVIGDNKLRIKDKRPVPAMRHRIKFTGKLHDYQVKPVKRMIRKKRGILEAPPRAGKTVMAIKIGCKLGLKMLILAKQYDWLQQFYETIYGVKDKKGRVIEPALTNVPDIEEEKGRKICGFFKSVEDVDKYDIVLATYQSFISKRGKKRLEKIRSKFGLIVIDEAHGTPAEAYLRVVGELNAMYLIGLTGTPERKDGREKLSNIVLGTVKAVAKIKTLIPTVELVETGAGTTYQYKAWVYAVNYLSRHPGRNKVIAKWAVKDVKANRSIVIPVERTDHVKVLVDLINKYAKKTIAIGFHGKISKDMRNKVRDGAKKYRYPVVVGMRKMVQVGINVPRWDTLYVPMPIANPPNFKQETSRIRTNVKGKEAPLIRHFVEDFGVTKGCLRTCWWQTYIPEGFIISEQAKVLSKKYMSNAKIRNDEPVVF